MTQTTNDWETGDSEHLVNDAFSKTSELRILVETALERMAALRAADDKPLLIRMSREKVHALQKQLVAL